MVTSSATASLILDKRSQKKDGTIPVKLRVLFQRNKQLYGLNIAVSETDWDLLSSARSPRGDLKAIKLQLQTFEAKANQIIKEINTFTFEGFKLSWFGVRKDKKNVSDAIHVYAESCRAEGRLTTATSYIALKSSLAKFEKKIDFEDITTLWLKKYENHLLNDNKSETTVGIYMRTLRAICNKAIKDQVMAQSWYPFTNYTPPKGSGRNIALSRDDISKIFDAELPENSSDDRARDFFILSYLCNGMNFKDIALLRCKNIRGESLEFIRSKTKRTTRANPKPIRVFLNEKALKIIEKWRVKREKDVADDFIFDVVLAEYSMEQQQRRIEQFIRNTNDGLKRIAKTIGIDPSILTTYTARHSFASNILKSGASKSFIQESLGHNNIATTEAYLSGFDDSERKKWSDALL